MTNIVIKISGATAHRLGQQGILTTGMAGATVTFEFGPEWAGLSKVAVFRGGGVTRDVVGIGDTVPIPVEVLQAEGYLAVGVEGYDADRTLVIPTTWEYSAANIHAGANASGDPAADPSLPIWAQLEAKIGDLSTLDTDAKTSLVAAVNELAAKSGGTVDDASVAELVEQYLADNPITAADVGAIPAPTTATVGQTIRVKAVDGDGKPVEWECVDLATGDKWRKIAEETIDGSGVASISISEDADGNPINLKKALFLFKAPNATYSAFIYSVAGEIGKDTLFSSLSYSYYKNQPVIGFVDMTAPHPVGWMASGNGYFNQNTMGFLGGARNPIAKSQNINSMSFNTLNGYHWGTDCFYEVWGVDA